MNIDLDEDRLRGAKVEETDWGYTLHGTGDPACTRCCKGLSLAAGVAAIFTCLGVWVLPGATFAPELLPLKLTVSSLLFLVGCFFVQVARSAERVEVQIDLVRREVRVLERVDGEPGGVIGIWPFIEIGLVEVRVGRFVVCDRNGSTLADLRIGRAGGLPFDLGAAQPA